MAYIYRYQLRNPILRVDTNLAEYSNIIQSVIEGHFGLNLKDIMVEEKYFEFKLYATVSSKFLREMGRKLKSKLPIEIEKYGFVRMEQTLYVIVYPSRDDHEDIDMEFIDSVLFDKPEQYMQRAIRFFEKVSSRDLLQQKTYIDDINAVIKNYYLDVLNAYVNKNSLSKLYDNADTPSCFFIKGYHRRYDNELFVTKQHTDNIFHLEKSFDVGYVENREQISEQEDKKSDYLEIHMLKKQNDLIQKIENELKLLLSPTKRIDALDKIERINGAGKCSNYKFRVHNVGQALATSLSISDDTPFLYFDYGMPYGGNVGTRPAEVYMPTKPGITIILSHVDQDHWFRIADDFNAYQCNWFIPNQPRKTLLTHVVAEIIVSGGTVQMINSNIVFRQGRITCGGISKIEPSRSARHVHETGLTLRLDAHDVHGNDFNILIAGDQRYDYIDVTQLRNLDLLVASHHGGAYSWSVCDRVPNARSAKYSTVIYSYGVGNTYRHPNRQTDYTTAKWNQVHHTTHGDYVVNIYL